VNKYNINFKLKNNKNEILFSDSRPRWFLKIGDSDTLLSEGFKNKKEAMQFVREQPSLDF